MRISLVIAALAAIAVGMVHIRRSETRTNYQLQQLQVDQIYLRRKLYDQQANLGRLIAPKEVRERMGKLDVRLTSRVIAPPAVAHRLSAETPDGRHQ
jgi:hypothetical protein